MTFKLREDYDNPIEARMAQVAWLIANEPDAPYETDGEGLFALLVRGLGMYVQAWIDSGDTDSLAALMVSTDDLNDPGRADDPHAAFYTMLDLTLEALRDNLRCERDPDWGQA